MAALTTRLGKEGILPYLNQILQPLYRIQESGSAPNTDEVHTHSINIRGLMSPLPAVAQSMAEHPNCVQSAALQESLVQLLTQFLGVFIVRFSGTTMRSSAEWS